MALVIVLIHMKIFILMVIILVIITTKAVDILAW